MSMLHSCEIKQNEIFSERFSEKYKHAEVAAYI